MFLKEFFEKKFFLKKSAGDNKIMKNYPACKFILIGEESDIQDFIPISPQQVFNVETGQLSIREDNQLSPRRRKLKNRPTSTSPLIGEGQQAGDRDRSDSGLQSSEGPRSEALEDQPEVGYLKRQVDPDMENIKLALPGTYEKLLKIEWFTVKQWLIQKGSGGSTLDFYSQSLKSWTGYLLLACLSINMYVYSCFKPL